MKILNELKRIINENNVDIWAVFKNFDKSGDGKLDENEFSKLVLVIDKNAH